MRLLHQPAITIKYHMLSILKLCIWTLKCSYSPQINQEASCLLIGCWNRDILYTDFPHLFVLPSVIYFVFREGKRHSRNLRRKHFAEVKTRMRSVHESILDCLDKSRFKSPFILYVAWFIAWETLFLGLDHCPELTYKCPSFLKNLVAEKAHHFFYCCLFFFRKNTNAFPYIFQRSAQVLGLRLCLKQPAHFGEWLEPSAPWCLVLIFGCCFSSQLTFFFLRAALEKDAQLRWFTAWEVYFWILIGSWAAGLFGVKWCPAPSGIRKSGMPQMAIPVTAVSWQQANVRLCPVAYFRMSANFSS